MVSLKTLFDLADHLERRRKGEKLNTALVNRLARASRDPSCRARPQPLRRRTRCAFGYWTEKHIDAQRKLNLRAVIEKAAGDAGEAEETRGTADAVPARHAGRPATTCTTRRPARRSSTPIRCSSAATTSSASRAPNQTWRSDRSASAPAGRPTRGGRLVGSLCRSALRAGRGGAELPDSDSRRRR